MLRTAKIAVTVDLLKRIMKKCPDTVTMCLLKADMFSIREKHVTKSMQGLSRDKT
jgi:hypothetical protein